MRIDVKEAVQLLQQQDNILIIAHRSPDGDTIGSAFGLYYILEAIGKKSRILCADPFPEKYDYMTCNRTEHSFEPSFIVSVDVADALLMGRKLDEYKEKVDLCIDHHKSNTLFAHKVLLQEAAATAEIIYQIGQGLGVPLDENIANCIYTGIATDTGCFNYSNTTASSHLIAADLIACGIDYATINRVMFETKSMGRVEIERLVYNRLEYYFNRRCALIYITREMLETAGVAEDELEGLSALPRQIEGVEVGVTLRQRDDLAGYKISVRTTSYLDASKVCALLGGGGHTRAAGCFVPGEIEAAKTKVLAALEESFKEFI